MDAGEVLEQVKSQTGSNGEKGWPVAVRDRIHFPSPSEDRVSDANTGVTFLWTERMSVVPHLEKDGLAIATNFYTPAGLQGMVRNVLGNPFVRRVVMLGNEYSSKGEGSKGELTSANAVRAFFERGVNSDRKIDGFGKAVCFDPNIPLDEIELVRRNVELIDLNRGMQGASLEDQIKEANRIITSSERLPPFASPKTFDYEGLGSSFPYEGGPLIVHGETIPEAWMKMVRAIDRFGRPNLMNAGTDRQVKEINNMTVVVHDPQNEDLGFNPFAVPMTPEKIRAYQEEILSPIKPEGKAYTYGNELRAYLARGEELDFLANPNVECELGGLDDVVRNITRLDNGWVEINQVADIIDVLNRDAYSKAAVAITWHPANELMRKHKSSPCWALMQPMVQDDRLNLMAFFRSHDMFQGWPENAYGVAAVQREIAEGIGVEPGLMTVISGSAQLYNNYAQQIAQTIEQHGSSTGFCSDKRGNYLINVGDGEITAKLTHPDTGIPLEEVRGKSAQEVADEIASRTDLLTSHALYLGRELAAAEASLRTDGGKSYVQT